MELQTRYDFVPISSHQRTDEGYLVVRARISRTGVQRYLTMDGIRREYRPPEEVGDSASLDSFRSKVVTLEHPPNLLTADNTRDYARGFSSADVAFDGRYVETVLTVTDSEAIDAIESGRASQISAGYRVELEPVSGTTPDGEHYDAIQRCIRGNHIALVERGRAGPEVRVLDTGDAGLGVMVVDEAPELPPQTEELAMSKINLDGVEFEASEALAVAIASTQRRDEADRADMQSKLDEATAAVARLTDELTSLRSELDAAGGRADALSARVAELESAPAPDVDGLVNARLSLIKAAAPHLPTDFAFDGLSTRAVHEAVIRAIHGDADMSERSDEYVAARFDAAIELSARTDSTAALKAAVESAGAVDAPVDMTAIQRQRLAEGWKKPLTAHKGV